MRLAAAMMMVVGLLIADPAMADTTFEGQATQGGLLIGRTHPGARIVHDGRLVRVTADGRFLIGFGRDASATSRVVSILPDGRRDARTIAVAPRRWDVQRIDGLPARQVTPPEVDWARIRRDSDLIKAARRIDSAAPLFESGFQWPVTGRISGPFGGQRILNGTPKRPHKGVDVAAPRGTPVGACADGVVTLVQPDMFYTGKTVMLDHGHGLSSIYVHLHRIAVSEGQHLAKGQVLGTVGQTGRATGPHLHWGVSLFATHLDPQLLVPPMDH